MIERILINGIVLSGLYAVLAVGFSLIFGVAKIVNMSHTALYMVTAFLVYLGTTMLGFNYVLSSFLAIIVTTTIGLLSFKLIFDRIKVHMTAVMIVSIAVALAFQEIILIIMGGDYRGISHFVVGYVNILGVSILYQHLFAMLGCFLTLFAVWVLLRKTNLGKAIRAVAEDTEVANLMGIDVSRVCMITMGISACLAGIASVLTSSLEPIYPSMWLQPLVTILAAVILGGLGNIKGSILGAFILGFTETTMADLIPGGSFLRGTVALIAMVVVLLIKPEGLFGIIFEEERI